MKIVSAEQMRTIEDRSEEAGVYKDTLMENASLAIAKRIRHYLSPLKGVPVLILVGPGNNGGDGLVVARHLHKWDARVLVYLCANRRAPDSKLDIIREQGVPITSVSDDNGLEQLKEALESAHMVVDSVLGTGRARPIEGILKDIFSALKDTQTNRPMLKTLAVDLPTGLDADTGQVDPLCPTADVTMTMAYPKIGHLTHPGADSTGALEITDIGLPAGLDTDVKVELITPEWAKTALPHRPSSAHKGSFGRAMVVAGSRNYIGAAYLAGTAATRVGAGLVTIALPESIQMAVASKAIEPTYLPLPESSPGVPSLKAASVIFDNLPNYESLLIGCGMGQAPDTIRFIENILYSGESLPSTIVDADGLNTLAQTPNWWHRVPDIAIVTPHPGEMSRLTGKSTGEVQADRLGIATESAIKWNKIVVLKGAYTVIAYTDGRAMISPFANPGLASAGTGDVLAGTIAGLLSQGVTLEDAAPLGVYLHGLAGEAVRDELGDTGMVASDLLPLLPRVIKGLNQ